MGDVRRSAQGYSERMSDDGIKEALEDAGTRPRCSVEEWFESLRAKNAAQPGYRNEAEDAMWEVRITEILTSEGPGPKTERARDGRSQEEGYPRSSGSKREVVEN